MTTSRFLHTGRCLLLASLLFPSMAAAVDRTTYAMSEFVYKEMQSLQEMVEVEQYSEALEDLGKLRERRLTDYELAHNWNLVAFIYYKQDKYPEAINAYVKMLKSEQLPDGLRVETVKRLAQLSFTIEKYEEAISYCRELLNYLPTPDPSVHMIMGQAFYSMEKYRESLEPVMSAINIGRSQGTGVKENWLLLLNAIYYNLTNYKGMQDVLRELIQLYPQPKYMLNLAAVYSELGDTESQTALLEALYDGGYLEKENQFVNLANLYMLHKVPYKAAVLLENALEKKQVEKNMKNYNSLAQAWQLAGDIDRAVAPMARAAELAEDGNTYVRLAQLHISRSRWQEAEQSLVLALEKGDVRNTANAHLMLGMARFNQKRFGEARDAFRQAGKKAALKKLAGQWLSYITSEEEKYELLK